MTKNFHDALHQLRRFWEKQYHSSDCGPITPKLKTVPFWIDALCINQADVDERSKQVPRIGTIYGSAEHVFACLGDPYKLGPIQNAPVFQDLANLDYSKMGSLYLASFMRAFDLEDLDGHDLPLCTQMLFDHGRIFDSLLLHSEDQDETHATERIVKSLRQTLPYCDFRRPLKALVVLLSRGWFFRTWVVQEFAPARNPLIVFSGDFYASLSSSSILHKFYSQILASPDQPMSWIHNDFVFERMSLFMRFGELSHSNEHGVQKPPTNLRRLTKTLMEFLDLASDKLGATMPHHRIYGLSGLVDTFALPQSLVPDYGLTFEQIYRRYSTEMIAYTDKLDFLARSARQLGANPS